MRPFPVTKKHFVTLIAIIGFGLIAVQPALACREGKAMVPPSASKDGALARYVEATHAMSRKDRRAYSAAMPSDERAEMRAEFRALPEEERRALSKALRDVPKAKNSQATGVEKSQP